MLCYVKSNRTSKKAIKLFGSKSLSSFLFIQNIQQKKFKCHNISVLLCVGIQFVQFYLQNIN